jgi:hypothetical protein
MTSRRARRSVSVCTLVVLMCALRPVAASQTDAPAPADEAASGIPQEVSLRVDGYSPGPHVFGFGIEKRAGQHMFQLNLTNAFGTTFGQIARGGFPTTLYLGFNLARKFF